MLAERVPDLRGVVRPAGPALPFEVAQWDPPAALVPLVSRLWGVAYSFPDGVAFAQLTLPDPVVHVVFEGSGADVVGPMPKRFKRELRGAARVLGLRFRPAMFRAFCAHAVWDLRERRVPVDTFFSEAPITETATQLEGSAQREAVCRWLEARAAALVVDRRLLEVRDLVERVQADRSIRSVPNMAGMVGVSERTLQRQFRDAVGWTPAEVLRRRRIQDALAAIEAREVVLAELALELGYCDQAHLCRDFRALVGRSPRAYAAEVRPELSAAMSADRLRHGGHRG